MVFLVVRLESYWCDQVMATEAVVTEVAVTEAVVIEGNEIEALTTDIGGSMMFCHIVINVESMLLSAPGTCKNLWAQLSVGYQCCYISNIFASKKFRCRGEACHYLMCTLSGKCNLETVIFACANKRAGSSGDE